MSKMGYIYLKKMKRIVKLSPFKLNFVTTPPQLGGVLL
jgi:hypothetical protein